MKKNLTRDTLTNKIYQNIGLSKNLSNLLVTNIFNEIIEGLIQSKHVKISSFGTFKTINKNERIGRNPKTKEETKITSRKVVSFKASKQLKNKINS
tara:strand:+ start:3934 stop:4221 length:288 start_codon:yes stop_codon:yes gene_type:complete